MGVLHDTIASMCLVPLASFMALGLGCGSTGAEEASRDGETATAEQELTNTWSKSFGDASSQTAQSIATDSTGKVVLAGTFQGSVNFGGGALRSAGSSDVFVAKLTSGGSFLAATKFGDASSQNARAVAVDGAQNLLVVGDLQGSMTLRGCGTLTSAGASDLFVTKLSPSGSCVWAKRFGDAAAQLGGAVAIAPSNAVVLAGPYQGSLDFGAGPLVSQGGQDVYIAELDATGIPLWSRSFGGLVRSGRHERPRGCFGQRVSDRLLRG